MKNCTYCHEMLEDDMQFCPNCGAPVPKPETVLNGEPTAQAGEPVYTAVPVTPAEEPKKNNGLAIAGLVLGILSVCCCCANPLFSILAIVFGAIALSQIAKNDANGKGMAIAALIIGIATLVMFVVSIPLSGVINEVTYDIFDDYGVYDDIYDYHYDYDFDYDTFLGELDEI